MIGGAKWGFASIRGQSVGIVSSHLPSVRLNTGFGSRVLGVERPYSEKGQRGCHITGSRLGRGQHTPGRGPVPPPLAPILVRNKEAAGRGQGPTVPPRAPLGQQGGHPMVRTFQTHLRPFSSRRSPKFLKPQALGSCWLLPEDFGTDTLLFPAVLS